jgi:hypothetical protein
MAERSDITTDWSESPRIIEVAAPSADIILQDLHDTCRSDVKQPGEGGDTLDNMDDEQIIDSAGKEDLGGGVLVGITSTLQNAQVAFESRITPTSSGTVTTTNAAGTLLIDAAGTFVTDLVERGAVVINFADESISEVLEVLSETQLITRVLRAGTLNQYTSADAYKIWNIIQCDIEGGNLVAVDTDGTTPISPVFPTAFTQIVRTSSSSATLQEQADIEYSSFGGGVTVDVTSIYAGTNFPVGTPRQPVNNMSDALAIATDRGFSRYFIIGNITIPVGPDLSNSIFEGESVTRSTITIPAAATANNCEYTEAFIQGTLDGASFITTCNIGVLEFLNGEVRNCGFTDIITLGGGLQASFIDCHSEVPGTSTAGIDMGGSGQSMLLRNYSGGITLTNKTGTDDVSIDMSSGQIVIDDTVTAGTLVLRGVARWTNRDTYAGGATILDQLVYGERVTEVWKLLGLDPGDTITITPAGVSTEDSSFAITFTGDGVNTTTMDRTA